MESSLIFGSGSCLRFPALEVSVASDSNQHVSLPPQRGSEREPSPAYLNTDGRFKFVVRSLCRTTAACRAGFSWEEMGVLWGHCPGEPGHLLQGPEITALFAFRLCIVHCCLPCNKIWEIGQGRRKESASASCLLEKDNSLTKSLMHNHR